MITVNAPDGSVVNFPDGTGESTINDVMSQKFAPQAENSLSGSATQLGVGAAEGLINLAGLPADLANLAGVESAKPYGSENIKKIVEGYTGEFRKPQTTFEKVVNTVGNFAPGMLVGPGGLATRALTQAVVPGVASEAAGQLTEGTALEPAARIGAALTGAVGASKVAQGLTAPKAAAAPTREAIAAETKAGYSHPEVAKLEIDKGAAGGLADVIKRGLDRGTMTNKMGPIPEFMAPQTYKAVDLLKAVEGPTARVADIDGVRKTLGTLAGEMTPLGKPTPNALAAQHAQRAIDLFMERLPKSAVVAGDAKAVSQILRNARADAAVGFRSDKITQMVERAMNNANATHSGGNLENEIYKQIRTWLNNPSKHLRGWTQEEKAALKAIQPDKLRGLLRRAGKLMGGGGGLGQLASGSAGGAMFGLPGMVGLPALGMAANKLGSSIASNKVGKLDELIRSRSSMAGPQSPQAMLPSGLSNPQLQNQMLIQTLLAARQQQSANSGR